MNDYEKVYNQMLLENKNITTQQKQQVINEMFNGDPRQYNSFLKQVQQYTTMAVNQAVLPLQHEINDIKNRLINIEDILKRNNLN